MSEVKSDEYGTYVEPVCPKCGESEFVRYAIRTTLVYEGIERIYSDYTESTFDMGDVPESEGGFEEIGEDRYLIDNPEAVICWSCKARFEDYDVVLDQRPPKTEGEAA